MHSGPIHFQCVRSSATTSATTSHTGWTWASACVAPPAVLVGSVTDSDSPCALTFSHAFQYLQAGAKAPKVFVVNWFRKDGKGKFIWPGFGDNR